MSFTPKGGVAYAVTGIPGGVTYRAEEREDGTVRIRQCEVTFIAADLVSPQLYDLVTRADGSKWAVVGVSPNQGQVTLTIEDHEQLEKAAKGFRLR